MKEFKRCGHPGPQRMVRSTFRLGFDCFCVWCGNKEGHITDIDLSNNEVRGGAVVATRSEPWNGRIQPWMARELMF